MDCYCFFFIHIYYPQKLSERIVIIIMLSPWNCTSVFPYCFIAPIIPFFFFHLILFHAALAFLTFMSVCFLFLSWLPKCITFVSVLSRKKPNGNGILWRKKICVLSFMQFFSSKKVHYRKLWLVIWVLFRMTLHAETDCELSAAVYRKGRKVSKKNHHYHHHDYCRHPSSHLQR